jgi:hypothetical protein
MHPHTDLKNHSQAKSLHHSSSWHLIHFHLTDIHLQKSCDVLPIKSFNLINNPFECLCGPLASSTCPLLLHEHSQSLNQVIHRTLGHNCIPSISPPYIGPRTILGISHFANTKLNALKLLSMEAPICRVESLCLRKTLGSWLYLA